MIAQIKKFTLAVGFGAVALAASTPADAQRYRGGYYGRDNGDALVAGLAGLAIGTALASSSYRGYDDYYYDRGYRGRVVVYPSAYYGYYADRYPRYNYRGYNGYAAYYGNYPDYRGSYYGGRGYRGGYDRDGRGRYRR